MNLDELADPGEPMNGIAALRSYDAVPNLRETQHAVQRIRKTLRELPTDVKQMNGISVVFIYNLLGISKEEIALGTGLTVEQVSRIVNCDAYQQLEAEVVSTIINRDSDDVKRILASGSQQAARRVVELVASDDPMFALPASKDILDRTGHKPTDRVEHTHNMQLRVVYVDDDAEKAPLIDITPGDKP